MKNESATDPQSRLKVWFFVMCPVIGALLALAGHLFIR